ncbi:MAG TPA: NAD(P)-dependent oxidoreductase [Usitatibacter sp.]|nr:NAD(P)-dependent oxidoreductase [Usitatibacter sp.]
MSKVAFIGLGVMGYPMAGHLKSKGHEVTVYNRTGAKASEWVGKHGGKSAPTPAAAAKDADFVMLMVGNDNDVFEVALGKDGALSGMKKGAVLIDHTTASADAARKVAAAAKEKGVEFIDAPVSGGQAGAENGKLTVMCGGEKAAFDRAKPVMDSYGRAVTLLGPAGSGQLTKMVNQICIAGLVQALSEGIAFAEHAKLDPLLVLDVISKGAAQSWQMENRGKTMTERKFDFGFAVDWMRKDLGICLEEAKRNGAKLPVTQVVAGYYDEVSKSGGKRWDTSSLITRL